MVTIRLRLYLLQALLLLVQLPLLKVLVSCISWISPFLGGREKLELRKDSIQRERAFEGQKYRTSPYFELFLTISGTSLCNCVTNTHIDRYYKIDDNFVLIIWVQVRASLATTICLDYINNPKTDYLSQTRPTIQII
jgi:hypothetical protein